MPSSNLDQIGEQIARDAAHIDAAHHRLLTAIRVFDAGIGYFDQGFRSCAQWLSWRVGWTPQTAREHVRVANALATLPKIDHALERGELSYCKVRALTRVATPANEDTLLEFARETTGQQLEQLCRKYASVRTHATSSNPRDDIDRRYVTRRTRDDGMVAIEAVLHPDEAAILWAAIERVAAERCRAATARGASTGASNASAETLAPTSEAHGCHDASAETPRESDSHDASAETLCECGSQHASAETPCESASRNASAETPYESASHDASAETPRESASHDASAEAPRSTWALPSAERATAAHRKRPAFDRAQALVDIAQQIVRGNAPNRSPSEIVISIPIDTLRQDPNSVTDDPTRVACCADGTPLSLHITRRLACDAGIISLIEDANGNALTIGRKHRVVSGAAKRALMQRDQCCRFPGCTARVFLESHHLRHWADGGLTVLANLLALCSYHHKFVHEYGFKLELDTTTNTVTAYGPDRTISSLPPPPFASTTMTGELLDLGWPNITRRNERLGITDSTQECWDGTPVEYPDLVDFLLRDDARAEAASNVQN